MPSYEFAVIVKALEHVPLKDALKSVCTAMMKEGGVIKKMENLGTRELPQPLGRNKKKFSHGSYFVFKVDAPVHGIKTLTEVYNEDENLLRFGWVGDMPEKRRPCLDGPCHFGEMKNIDHDRLGYRRKLLASFGNWKRR